MERSAPDSLPGPAILSASDILALANAKRIRLGMSWRAVAREVGCAASTLSRWSNGRGSPSIAALYAVYRWARGEVPPCAAPPSSPAGRLAEVEARYVDPKLLGHATEDIAWLIARVHSLERELVLTLRAWSAEVTAMEEEAREAAEMARSAP